MGKDDEFETNPFSSPQTDLTSDGDRSVSGFVYAGFWQRFVAFLLDHLIMGALYGAMLHPLRLVIEDESHPIVASINAILVLALPWLYFALQESSETRATIGKWALGLTVVNLGGEQISFGRATGRWFGKFVSAMICYAGFLIQPFAERKQALHDMMAGTLVVKAQR